MANSPCRDDESERRDMIFGGFALVTESHISRPSTVVVNFLNRQTSRNKGRGISASIIISDS